MRITLTTVLLDDQNKAFRFYTDVLGFQEKTEIPLGEHSWLTVVSPDDPDGTQLVLEPDAHPAAKSSRRRSPTTGSRSPPFSSMTCTRSSSGYGHSVSSSRRNRPRWVPVSTAVFNDTCGNLIQIHAARQPSTA